MSVVPGEAQHGLLGLVAMRHVAANAQIPLDLATAGIVERRDRQAGGEQTAVAMAHLQRARARPGCDAGFDERDEGPPFIAVAPLFDVGGIMNRIGVCRPTSPRADQPKICRPRIGKLMMPFVSVVTIAYWCFRRSPLQGGACAELGLRANAAVDLIPKRTVGARQPRSGGLRGASHCDCGPAGKHDQRRQHARCEADPQHAREAAAGASE